MIKAYHNIRPIYQKETISSSRTSRLTVIVLVFNVILTLVGLLQLQLMVRSSSYYGEMPYSSLLQMYTLVAAFEAAFLLFIVPGLTAGSISGERERQTLDLLLCTRLRPLDIIIGKLLSCLSTVFVLIFSSLPVLSLVYIYGGIGLKDLGILFFCLIVTALFTGSVSIFFSAWMKKTTMATVMSYMAVVFMVAGTYLILQMIYNILGMLVPDFFSRTDPMGGWNYLLLLNPAVTFYSLFRQQIGGDDSLLFQGWYNSYILTNQLLSYGWVAFSCGIQLGLSGLFVWLASRGICPLRKRS